MARLPMLVAVSAACSSALLVATVVADGQRSQPARSTPVGEGRPPAVKALYVTGGGFHDFTTQATIVPPGLAARVPIDWTIDHTAGTSTEALIPRHATTEWTKDFDVVVYNMSFSHVVDVPWIERLAGAHRESGVGAVILHGAVHSYRRSTSRAWGELMGAFSMRHDSRRPLRIETVEPSHPVMQGFPADWQTIDEELYEIIQTWPGVTPLARAHSTETGTTSPVIWTNTAGKARVFVTTLGHDNEMMRNPVYLDLVARGLRWTIGRLD